MTVLVVLNTVLLVVLAVLVAGLLRAYATVLQRLHRLDGGLHEARDFSVEAVPATVGDPQRRDEWATAHDVAGETVLGEVVASRVVGVEHDTVLVFLSSGCSSCQVFWDEFRHQGQLGGEIRLPALARLMIVTQGPEADSRAALVDVLSPGLDVVMSSRAWTDYEVPGSPYVVLVDGRTGRVRGEGTGQSWAQISELLARASGDAAYLTGGPSRQKPGADIEREVEADRELLAAGILPGDAQLYGGDVGASG